MSYWARTFGLPGKSGVSGDKVGEMWAAGLDDEIVIEPHGGTVVLGAAMVAEFEDGLITAYRNYFDDITIFDQMLAPG